jgi:hypothetical protein
MSLGEMTVKAAAKGLGKSLWRGILWTLVMFGLCLALGIEWGWRPMVLCIMSSLAETIIYLERPVAPANRTFSDPKS